jgi:aspartyl/asparaginyl-tRNA synthetase
MIKNYKGVEDIETYSELTNKLRTFFLQKGFVEVNTQDRLSILAACEDPTTVATYKYMDEIWPLPQTGQMWLEYELLKNPKLPGVFCISTSYRNEKNPVKGRHKLIFPMFEFESKGNIKDLEKLETELLQYLGFAHKANNQKDIHYKSYDEMKSFYKVEEISHKEENKMLQDFGPALFLKQFPIYTSPFWNMKKNAEGDNSYANKIDVILYGNETIGSAERSCDVKEMKKQFQTISGGGYAKKLYKLFGKQRVDKELKEFLSMDFFPRYGGGIGMTRLISAYKQLQNQN